MDTSRIIESPFSWAVVGFVVGAALGVTALSVWILAAGFGLYLIFLSSRGPAKHETEGWLFAAGPAFMMSWMLGFVVRGIVGIGSTGI